MYHRAGQQQAVLRAGDHVLDRAGTVAHLEDEVVDHRGHRLAGHPGGVAGLEQAGQQAVADPVGALEGQAVVEDGVRVV